MQQTQALNLELNHYLFRVYNYIAAGLIVSGICSIFLYNFILFQFSANPMGIVRILNLLNFLCLFGTLGIILYIRFQSLAYISLAKLNALYWAFVAIIGLDYTVVMFVYTIESLVSVFFITAGMFIVFSFYGYYTQSDLSAIQTFATMAVIGVLICLIVNIFLQSSVFQYIISVFGVIVFAVLTAYDSQRIKDQYLYYSHVLPQDELVHKSVILGALTMYLNFINMFNFLLYLFGNRKD